MNLTDKYRPADFNSFKGSPLVVKMLRKVTDSETLPNCMLFSGGRGSGKTSMARIISNHLNGPNAPLSFLEIDAASNNGIDDVRKLKEMVGYTHPGKWRVVSIDEVHNLSSPAFNALLKVLEEPPARTTFILSTTQPELIPDTVRSRAMQYRFQNLDIPTIARHLAEIVSSEGITHISPSVIVRIAETSEGSMRNAIVTLQQLLQLDHVDISTVNELKGYTVSTKDIMYAMLTGTLYNVDLAISGVFGSTCDVDILLKSLLDTLKEFHSNSMINDKQFLNSVTIIWNMRNLQRKVDSVSRMQLEAGMYAMFMQSFWDGSEGTVVKADEVLNASDVAKFSK